MSRCVLDDEARGTEVVIGWDPGMGSFFARVFDNQAARRARGRGADEAEVEQAGLVLWTGGFDRAYTSQGDLRRLIGAIQPHAGPHDPDRLLCELLRDQAMDSERSYSLVEDDGPDPYGYGDKGRGKGRVSPRLASGAPPLAGADPVAEGCHPLGAGQAAGVEGSGPAPTGVAPPTPELGLPRLTREGERRLAAVLAEVGRRHPNQTALQRARGEAYARELLAARHGMG